MPHLFHRREVSCQDQVYGTRMNLPRANRARSCWGFICLFLIPLACAAGPEPAKTELVVFAASSLKEVFGQQAAQFGRLQLAAMRAAELARQLCGRVSSQAPAGLKQRRYGNSPSCCVNRFG